MRIGETLQLDWGAYVDNTPLQSAGKSTHNFLLAVSYNLVVSSATWSFESHQCPPVLNAGESPSHMDVASREVLSVSLRVRAVLGTNLPLQQKFKRLRAAVDYRSFSVFCHCGNTEVFLCSSQRSGRSLDHPCFIWVSCVPHSSLVELCCWKILLAFCLGKSLITHLLLLLGLLLASYTSKSSHANLS